MANTKVNEERLIKIVQDMVKIESHYLIPQGETKVGDYLKKLVEPYGFEVETQEIKDGRKNIYITLEGETPGKTLLYCGHMDTVRPDNMTLPAFDAYVEDGKIWGRGSVDMKGGIAAMIYALIYIKENNIPINGKVVFAGTIGEECPDASEGGMALGEKENFADMAVIGEATNLDIIVAHKGSMGIKVELTGKAAHGSMPHLGDNAIYKCTEYVEALRRELLPILGDKSHPYCGKPTLNVGVIGGGMQNNIVPDSCFFSYDRRYIPGETKEDLFEEILKVGESIGLKRADIKVTPMAETAFRGPMETDDKDPLVLALKSVTEEAGIQSQVCGVDYWTDGSHLSKNGVPTVVFGPGNIQQAHAAEEFIAIDSLVKSADCYIDLIKKLLGA